MEAGGGKDAIERARASLERIEHIVVLMFENRSFDHKFGYLSLEPEWALKDADGNPIPVNGLKPGDARQRNGDFVPEPFDEEVMTKRDLDPPHDAASVATQIAGGEMTGFVDAFRNKLRHSADPARADDPNLLKAVMGYLTPDKIPISDHLARNFCLCDNFFCSIPGPTLPNRFFSLAGTTNGVLDNVDLILSQFGKFKTLFRHLDDDAWRWYSSDPAILRAVDEQYMFDEGSVDHFAYFNEITERQPRNFLRDVLGDPINEPALPPVAWIDPNFAMSAMVPPALAHLLADGPLSDDDHPPSPALLGQKLLHTVYKSLGLSDFWHNSLLVVTYDEHGGFFDHQPPPPGHGPRVPVLLVGPHVKRGVCSVQLDHASVIKTILLRFGGEGSWNEMGERVAQANDLSVALRDDGGTIDFCAVENAGACELEPRDLMPAFLPHNGSTLEHALGFRDDQLTDLQRDLIRGVSVPLRSGALWLRRAMASHLVQVLVPFIKHIPLGRRRLPPRRP